MAVRALALVLFCCALAKVSLVQHLRLAGARDAVVAAYAADAIAACENAEPALKLAQPATAAQIDLMVGDRSERVSLWQVDHDAWITRFRKPFLVIPLPGGGDCRFEVVSGRAIINRKS